MMLPRQSTTVPNTSNSRACTFALAVMGFSLACLFDETGAPLRRRDHAGIGAPEQGVAVLGDAIIEPVGYGARDEAQRRKQAPAAPQSPANGSHTVELAVGTAVDEHE